MNIEEKILAHQNAYRAKRGDVMFDDDSSSDDGMDETTEDDTTQDDTTQDDSSDDGMDDGDVNMDTSNDEQIWTAGSFVFFSYYTGQGDCTFIVCPDGRTILLDCGSLAYTPPDFFDNLQSNMKQYCTNNLIDVVILTHSDQDHYNKMGEALTGFSVDNMYISTGGSASPLLNYSISDLSNKIYNNNIKVNFIKDVYLNKTSSNTLVNWKGPEFSAIDVKTENLTNPEEHRILVDTKNADPEWYVAIIASNVGNTNKTKGTNADEINTRSVVTKFWKKGKNGTNDQIAIFHGDATNTTTNFIKTTTAYPSYKFLFLGTIPHHGSDDDNCNEHEYINGIQPKQVLVSACSRYTSFFHPRSSILTLYEQYTDDAVYYVSDHFLDSWIHADEFKKGEQNEFNLLLDNWIANPCINVTDLGNGYYEASPKPANQPYIICPSKGMGLFRLVTQKPIFSTYDLEGVTPFEYLTM